MAARKRMYAMRKPSIIAILSVGSIQRLLEGGINGASGGRSDGVTVLPCTKS